VLELISPKGNVPPSAYIFAYYECPACKSNGKNNCTKVSKNILLLLNETVSIYCKNIDKKAIFEMQFYDPYTVELHFFAQNGSKFIDLNASTYIR
jgi:hypothetical protein